MTLGHTTAALMVATMLLSGGVAVAQSTASASSRAIVQTSEQAGPHYPGAEMRAYLMEDPGRVGINTHSFEFHPLHDTPAPRGYKPFYISHYGRHGSRSDWGGDSYRRVRDILAEAKAQGILRPEAEVLLRDATIIYDLYDGMDGRLTQRGAREHATIAERMWYRYKPVFKHGSKRIRAISSVVPRCLVSMNAETARLCALQGDLDISYDTGDKLMEYLARGSSVAIVERTRPVLDSVRHTWPSDTVTVLERLFTDVEAGRALAPRTGRLERDIFATARIAEAFDLEDDLFGFISEGAMYKWYSNNLLEIYLNEGNSTLNGDERIPLSRPLAEVMIHDADAAIAGGEYCADMRFGHDIPFVGLCCFFGLEGVSERLSYDDALDRWYGTMYVPFAATLQMVFYRSKRSDEVLVKFVLNERETLVPELTPVQGPYYRWEDVKALAATR